MSKIMMFVRHLQRVARNAVRSVNKIDAIPRNTTTYSNTLVGGRAQ